MSETINFKSLIAVSPLGFMYGSAGGFLSPQNLVGRSNQKFPPDTPAIAGLLLNANREHQWIEPESLKQELTIVGPFWAKRDNYKRFYVPISRHRIVGKEDDDEWELKPRKNCQNGHNSEWHLNQQEWHLSKKELKPDYFWQDIYSWNTSTNKLRAEDAVAKPPWRSAPFLHPRMKSDERHVVDKDGLFLENAVQLPEDVCLVYLTNIAQERLQSFSGWYRFGGEGHLVEIETHPLSEKHPINSLMQQKIGYACALITPGVWGSNNFSYRYPQHSSFPYKDMKMLTDKAVPYRFRLGKSKKDDGSPTGWLSRGRYAVPVGSVYVFREKLNMTWWDFPEEWFPKEGFSLKHLGCGLCLPVNIRGTPNGS
jgi:CRISPR-associated protein Cmr3